MKSNNDGEEQTQLESVTQQVFERKAEAETFEAFIGAALPSVLQTEGRVGEALRGNRTKQKKHTQLKTSSTEQVLDRKAEAESFEALIGAALPNVVQTEGCTGGALRGQGINYSQLKSTESEVLDEVIDSEAGDRLRNIQQSTSQRQI